MMSILRALYSADAVLSGLGRVAALDRDVSGERQTLVE